MIGLLPGSISSSLLAWWLFFALAPPQGGGPPSEHVRRVDGSIAQQVQEQEKTVLYFPDYVDGGGWSVQLALSNVDPDTAAEVRVEVYDPEGRPVLDLFDSDLTLEIPALGSRVMRSAGSGDIRRGWIQVGADAPAISGLLTYRHAESGVEVGVQSVELENAFALFVEESAAVGAGIAIFKPDASSGLELRIRDEEGNDPLEGGFAPWAEFHQSALTLPEWFSVEGIDTEFLDDFRGLLFLEAEDESPFAPLGLRFGKGTSSLSAVPAVRTRSQEPREAVLIFPDYVDGGGWSVQLVLSNVGPDEAAGVRVQVYGPDGQPVRDLFDSDLTLAIPALGSRVLKSSGSGTLRRGWIEVGTGAAAVSGLLTYRHARSGIEVGVEPAELGKQFALFVEESGTVGAGLALFKPDAESRVELRIRDEEGNDPLNGMFLPWRDFRQSALTLPEWFDVPGVDAEFLRDFRGLLFLRTEDESGFAPLGLRFGKGTSSLSAVPAIRIPDGGGIGGGHAPPPTVTLTASPGSIDRGQSTTLTWSSTNAESAEIEPDIGMVPASGSRKLSPNVTTTYRITVTGADGQTATESVTVTVAVSERVALGALFEALGGSTWTRSENWLTDAPLEEWYGVEVDSQGRVIELRMATWVDTEDGGRQKIGNGLTGSIPPELGSLAHLRVLDLSHNQLEGPIPAQLGNLSRLTSLNLSHNQLKGPIPVEIGNLSSLRWINLEGNRLTGSIPAELGNLVNLTNLDLSDNGLTGSIPAEFGKLTSLARLFLRNNLWLSGPLPRSLVALTEMQAIRTDRTGLCAPLDADFQVWLDRITETSVMNCGEIQDPVLPDTVWLSPDVITPADPSALDNVQYVGRGTRGFFDPFVKDWRDDLNLYLFRAHFGQHVMEVQAHPRYGSVDSARTAAEMLATPLGRLPYVLLAGGSELEISPTETTGAGGNACGGLFHLNGHTGDLLTGFIEEVLLHEGGHASLDDCNWPRPRTIPRHSGSAGWLAAQKADGKFLSAFARDHPNREDVAESIWGWFVVRCVPDRVPPWVVDAIKAGIPHRLAYFDSQDLDMSPYSCTIPAAVKAESRPQRPIPRGGEDE